MSVPHDPQHGWVKETDTISDILRSLASWATSVKVAAQDTRTACQVQHIKPESLLYGDPAFVQGVGERIERAVDVLREKLR
jgi:hypothetical protein